MIASEICSLQNDRDEPEAPTEIVALAVYTATHLVMQVDQSDTVTVWRILDGKPGHETQSLGLVNALEKLCPVDAYEIQRVSFLKALTSLIFGQFKSGEALPAPDLIIGAGHSTHWTVLAAKRSRGGKTALLMKPSLPASFFDLCLIPQHDGVPDAPNIVKTIGVLNTVSKGLHQSQSKGLILIGGPSSHFGWDADAMLGFVTKIVQTDRAVEWTLTTSRRTPEACVQSLKALSEPNLTVVPFIDTAKGWVNERLDECGTVWVTEESVSMVFESLTSGAGVGLLPVPLTSAKNRVSAGIDHLKSESHVRTFQEDASTYSISNESTEAFQEAERCAAIMAEKLLNRSE
ncbi:MAG: mitochondrial fission ELM1 family protein [Opitutaceae bacterium]